MSHEGLFTVPDPAAPEARFKPETLFKHYAYEALECYVKENIAFNRSQWLYKQATRLQLEGYTEDDEELVSYRERAVKWWQAGMGRRLEAASLFAATIGIPAKRDIIHDNHGLYHELVVAEDPTRQRELQARYRTFRRLYGGPVNAKRRDSVRKGRTEIIIPTYSNVDRHFDSMLDTYNAAKATHKPLIDPQVVAQAAGVPETTLNEPGEPVLAVYLVDAYSLMLQSLAARGLRVGRIANSMNFKEKLYAAIEPDTSELKLPPRYEGESVKAYAERTRISRDHLVKLAKVLHRQALGYTALWHSGRAGEGLVPGQATLKAWMEEAWHEEWSLRNGWDLDTKAAKEDQEVWLKQSIKHFRAVQRARNKAIKAAESPKKRGKKPRTGQMALLEEA